MAGGRVAPGGGTDRRLQLVVEMVPVVSSNVAAVGYDEDHRILQVRFHNGTVYEYLGVPATLYRALLDAPSKGSFINDHIKNGPYSYRQIQ